MAAPPAQLLEANAAIAAVIGHHPQVTIPPWLLEANAAIAAVIGRLPQPTVPLWLLEANAAITAAARPGGTGSGGLV